MNAVDLSALGDGVLRGDRGALSRAITLIESSAPRHEELAERLLDRLMPHTGGADRIGITGAPGTGKSTLIERLGLLLTTRGRRVAVLAVDPSSGVSGGSILGDKTRMEGLGAEANAFVRPSPNAGSLGGVASKTRESMLACEAAGFDVVLIETVGVGQSETLVADMSDVCVALMIPGAGDELQGIKRGLLEFADLIVVNKADGETLGAARKAVATYRAAARMARSADGERDDGASVRVVSCSAETGEGVEELWSLIESLVGAGRAAGWLAARRRGQMVRWMWSAVDDRMRSIARAAARGGGAEANWIMRAERGEVLPPIAARGFVDSLFVNRVGVEGERDDARAVGVGTRDAASTERGGAG